MVLHEWLAFYSFCFCFEDLPKWCTYSKIYANLRQQNKFDNKIIDCNFFQTFFAHSRFCTKTKPGNSEKQNNNNNKKLTPFKHAGMKGVLSNLHARSLSWGSCSYWVKGRSVSGTSDTASADSSSREPETYCRFSTFPPNFVCHGMPVPETL